MTMRYGVIKIHEKILVSHYFATVVLYTSQLSEIRTTAIQSSGFYTINQRGLGKADPVYVYKIFS